MYNKSFSKKSTECTEITSKALIIKYSIFGRFIENVPQMYRKCTANVPQMYRKCTEGLSKHGLR